MAKVKIQGHASGTGILTVTAPNTSTDRTITLPDADVTLGAATPSISDGGNATAITIDSSESVGIDNSTGFGTYSGTGVKYSKGDGTFFIGRDGGGALTVNRETDQGDMIALNVAGSSKVKIGTVSDGLYFGTGTGGNTKAMIINSDGIITKPLQPAFQAQMSNTQTDLAVSTWIQFPFNVEIFDQNADFNTSTYYFTAPVTGRYQLQIQVRYEDIANDSVYHFTAIETSNRAYYAIVDPGAWDAMMDYYTQNIVVLADMDANDTAKVETYQGGGSTSRDIMGNSETVFSGFLVA
jgi:hypothetical protein